MHYIDFSPTIRQEVFTILVRHAGDRFPFRLLDPLLHAGWRSADTTMTFVESTLLLVPTAVLGAALRMGCAGDRSSLASGDRCAGRWTDCWAGCRGTAGGGWQCSTGRRRRICRWEGKGAIRPVAAVAERKTVTAIHTGLAGKGDPGTSLDAYHTMGGTDLTIMAIRGCGVCTTGTGVGTQSLGARSLEVSADVSGGTRPPTTNKIGDGSRAGNRATLIQCLGLSTKQRVFTPLGRSYQPFFHQKGVQVNILIEFCCLSITCCRGRSSNKEGKVLQ